MINIGHDACKVIISRKKEREEIIEAYSPSSNYRIPANDPGSSKTRKHMIADFLGKSRDQHRADAPIGEDKINKTLQHKCFMHPKSSHTVFEYNSLRKALGAPPLNNTLPRV